MPRASARLRQWMPARQNAWPASSDAKKPSTSGATVAVVKAPPVASSSTRAATASGGR